MIIASAEDPPPIYTLSCSKLEYRFVETPVALSVKMLMPLTIKVPKASPLPTISIYASILCQAFSCRAKFVSIVVKPSPWLSLNLYFNRK